MKRFNSVSIAAVLLVIIFSQTSLALVVSNLNKTSYVVVNNGLNVGALEFVDRAYTFSGVPSAYQGETYIQTANNDRGSTGDTFLTFNIDQESTVYVAHDDRLANPTWLSSFTPTGDYLTSSDGGYTFSLYGKVFSAGTVTLGGNYGDGTVSMYSVVIIPVPITTAPDPASNPTPANMGTDISVETDLSWTAGARTISHDVYFGTTSPGDFQKNQPGTTFDPGVLANGTTYYWRIDEINAIGTTTGTVWSFTTESAGSAPDPASNPSPPDTATDVSINTGLSWTAGAGATSHDVYFGTTSPGDPQPNQTGTTFDPGTLALNTTYYWRINEVNAYGTTTGTVWSFTTTPFAYDQVGYWTMDDNAASATVVDVAGGYDGTFYSNGSPENTSLHDSSDFVEGTGSLDFDGNDYIALPRNAVLETGNATTKQLSAVAWIKDESGGAAGWGTVMGTGDGGWVLARNGGAGNVMVAGIWLDSGPLVTLGSSKSISDDQWHHVAIVYSGTSLSLYVDGAGISTSTSDLTIDNMFNKGVLIGENAGATGRQWNGLIDDVQIYDYALTAEDIHLMYNPDQAWSPSPVDGKTGASLDSTLSWSAGEGAVSHDVYFGIDESAVTNAQRLAGDLDGNGTVNIDDLIVLASQWVTEANLEDFAVVAADWGLSADPEFQGNQTGTAFDPGSLSGDTTYYWRIDEVSPAGTVTGKVWNFTTPVPVPIGSLIVDPDHPAWLKYAEGKHLYMCGPGDPEDFLYQGTRQADGTRSGGGQEAMIQKLATYGGNCIYFQAVKSPGGDDGDDPGRMNPFVDSNVNGLLDEDILNQWETWFTAMDNNGIVIFFIFYDDYANPFGGGDAMPAQEIYMVDTIVNRFEHHKNLIWIVSEEYQKALSAARVSNIAARIKLADDYDHPVGTHQLPGSSFDFNGDTNMDQFAMQLNDATTSFVHDSCVAAWNNVGGQKNVNLAEIYEWNTIPQTGSALRQKIWAAGMGGAYSMWLWMDIENTPTADLQTCGRLVGFMESTKFYMTQPSDSLKRGNTDYVMADPGNVYIVYSDSAGTQLGVNVQAGDYDVVWYDPIDGDWSDQGTQTLASGDRYFTRPSNISSTEAVLYLEKVWSTYGVEAENYDTQTGVMSWVLDTEVSGYNGTGYMRDTRNLHTDPSSTLNYSIDFPKAGTYYCYLRYWSLPSSDPDASYSNGFHLEFDGVRQSTLSDSHGTRVACYSTKEGAWKWATQWQYGESDVAGPLSFNVSSAGTHTLGITARDQLFKYDRIVITDYKVGGQDYSTSSAPTFLDVLETVPNGYN